MNSGQNSFTHAMQSYSLVCDESVTVCSESCYGLCFACNRSNTKCDVGGLIQLKIVCNDKTSTRRSLAMWCIKEPMCVWKLFISAVKFAFVGRFYEKISPSFCRFHKRYQMEVVANENGLYWAGLLFKSFCLFIEQSWVVSVRVLPRCLRSHDLTVSF